MTRLPPSEEIALINIQYGVGFGVIFQYCFTTNATPFNIWPSLSGATLGTFVCLVLYFFLDWLNANLLRGKVPLRLWRLLMWSLVIWFLAACVTLAIGVSESKYIFLASYVCIVGVYQLLSHIEGFYRLAAGPRLIGIWLSAMMILIGGFLLYNAALVLSQAVGTGFYVRRIAFWVVFSLLVIKGLFVVYLNKYIQET